MRKLTVKNFSVIKEAELEFGKITVLIGPQASGKSLLCKLAYFFSQVVPEIDYSTLTFQQPFDEFRNRLIQEFVEKFPADPCAPVRQATALQLHPPDLSRGKPT